MVGAIATVLIFGGLIGFILGFWVGRNSNRHTPPSI